MLPDRYTELLTAYVDGDLSARQRKAVLKLLHRSSEARTILKDMQEQSHAVRRLPAVKLDAGFADSVLHEIQVRGLKPGTSGTAPTVFRFPSAARWVAAAAVVLVAALGTYLYVNSLDDGRPSTPIAQEKPKLEPEKKPDPSPGPQEGIPPRKVVPDPMVAQLIGGTFEDFALAGFRVANPAEPAAQERLAREFTKDTAFHLSLRSRDTGKTVTHLLRAISKQVEVHVDAQAKAAMSMPGSAATFLVYAENLQADELTRVLGQLDGIQTDSLVVNALTGDDRDLLSRRLGISRDKLQAPSKDPVLLNPIPAPQPKGKKDKGDSTAPLPKLLPKSDAIAVVLALDADPSARSAQIAQFVKNRRPARAGTLQVMMLVQSA